MHKRAVREINRTERHGYVLGVTEEDQSDKRIKEKGVINHVNILVG